MKNLKSLLIVVWLFIVTANLSVAHAQPYPSRPIRILVGYAPGGVADIASRLLANALSESFGKPVIVDNRPGAAGVLAANLAAKSAPDGYTLLVSDSLVLMPSLFAKLPFDANKDFLPLSVIAIGPSVLVAHPSLPASSAKDLIALAKSKPGQFKFGSAGVGSMGHLMMSLFNADAGVQMLHVPYKGSTPALAALMSGEVDLLFTSMAGVLPQIRAGKIKPYGLGLPVANGSLPDVPSIDRSGLPGYSAASWQGIYAPAGTPKDVVDALSNEITKALRSPAIKEQFIAAGMEPIGNTLKEFAEFITKEIPKWERAIKAAGVDPQ